MTTQTPGANPGLLKAEEVMAELRVSRWTLDRLRKAQEIAATKVGGQWMYTQAAVAEYLSQNTVPAQPVGRTGRSRTRAKGRAA